MNWKINWDIVLLGRILGLAIIVGAILLAALDASTASAGLGVASHQKLRQFLQETLFLSAYGVIILAATEVAESLGPRASSPARIDWNLVQLI